MEQDDTYNVNDWDVLQQTLSPAANMRCADYKQTADADGEIDVFWGNGQSAH